jgi:DNA repair exonuclease SbcCD ATPase subunit
LQSNENENLDARINKYLKKTEEKRLEVEELEGLLQRGIAAVPLDELESSVQALKERVKKLQKEIEEQKQGKPNVSQTLRSCRIIMSR